MFLRLYFLSVTDYTSFNQRVFTLGTSFLQLSKFVKEKNENQLSFDEKVSRAMKAFKVVPPNPFDDTSTEEEEDENEDNIFG